MAIDATTHRQITGALGLPVNSDGQFLITLRNEPKHPQTHQKWQVTGGTIEHGESPESALAREMLEELSVNIRILFPNPIAKTWVWKLSSGEFHVLLLCYLVDIGQQSPIVDKRENIRYRWIYPEEINKLDILPLTDDFIYAGQQLVSDHNLLAKLS